MRILAVVDSVGLPRSSYGVGFQDCYLNRLGNNIWLIPNAGQTITNALRLTRSLAPYFEPKTFDMAVLQLGIVDCAPRIVPLLVDSILDKFVPGIWRPIEKWLRKRRPTIERYFYFQNTSLSRFRSEYKDLVGILRGLASEVVLVPIAPVNESVLRLSPAITKEINAYNSVIKEVGQAVSIPWEDNFLTDDAHVTKEAHELLANKILEKTI